MTFTPKSWGDFVAGGTPLRASALIDLETRVAAYSDLLTPVQMYAGTGAPTIAAPLGTIYSRTDAGSNQLYIKEFGAATSTGWSPVATASGTVSVKDYGAIGDGVTNDTAAIQAAIADIPSGGGQVFFPTGRYLANITVNKDDIMLAGLGRGSVIVPATGTGITITNCNRIVMQNMRITGGTTGLVVNGAAQGQFFGLYVDFCSGDGILVNGDGSTEMMFTDCWSRSHGAYSWRYTRTTTTDTGGIYFTHCLGTNSPAGSWKFECSAAGAAKAYAFLNQCVADGFSTGDGFVVDNIDDVRISQQWAVGTSPGKSCIRLNNAHSIVLTDVRAYQNDAGGNAIEFAGTTQYVTASGNYDGLGVGYLFTGGGTNDIDLDRAKNKSATPVSGTTNGRPEIVPSWHAPWSQAAAPAPTTNQVYFAAAEVAQFCNITGVVFVVDSVSSGNVKVALYSSNGTLVASSGSVAVGSANTRQAIAFSSHYMALPGTYHVALIPDNNTVRFASGWSMAPAGSAAAGSFTLPGSITVPAWNAAVLMPILATY